MSNSKITQVFKQIDLNRDNSVDSLKNLVRHRSISATGEGIRACAFLVKKMLEDIGASPSILELDEGSPLVFGEIRSKKNPKKTILFYNHYDVQPPEPLDLWESPPFEPRESEGKIYGRGVSDDKAELVGRLKLTEVFLETQKDIPCNFKFLIEGEEETGSTHLHEYFKKYPEIIKADAVIWEFGGVNAEGRPLVTLGVKGMLYVELNAENAKTDVHSSLGAVIENPAWRLVSALNTIKKGDRILIPGWYEDVRPFTRKELELIERSPSEERSIKKNAGVKKLIGNMKGLDVKKALSGKPTCTICGLVSGYTGEGSKTVLPRMAQAKIDFRLVPDQDPEKLFRKLRSHIVDGGFGDIHITRLQGERAYRTSSDEPIVEAARKAACVVFGVKKPPVIRVTSPATGPMYLFKAPCVAIGASHPSSKIHAPNENVRIDLFMNAMKWVADCVDRFART